MMARGRASPLRAASRRGATTHATTHDPRPRPTRTRTRTRTGVFRVAFVKPGHDTGDHCAHERCKPLECLGIGSRADVVCRQQIACGADFAALPAFGEPLLLLADSP